MRLIKFIFFLSAVCIGKTILGQGINTPFGQNRVQYGRFDWNYLRSENFDAFYYSGGKELATYCLKYVNDKLPILEDKMEHPLSGRIEIICFNTLSDLKQSNFGLEDQAQNTGGYTQVNSNKIYVYFNGDHADLARQLNEGIVLVLINEILYGGSLQERIQNAALLNLPEWFLRGLASYISKDWDADMDNRMKDGIQSKKFRKFNRLNQKDAVFAGHSIWKYIIESSENPEEVIKQVIYVVRVTRNYESAISFVSGQKTFKQIQKDWFEYYAQMYSKEDIGRNMPLADIKIKRRVAQYIQPQMKASSKGNFVSFTSNKNGKYKVWLLNTKTNKLKKILKGGLKYYQLEYDYSFPIVAWQQGGDKIAMVYEKKGKLLLKTLDLVNKKKEVIEFYKFDKITGFDFSDNGRTLIVTAIRKGQSDIFTYDIPSRKEKQLTNDIYDDAMPRYIDGSSKIIFSSNRPTDSLNMGVISSLANNNNYDVYIYDLEETPKTRMLKRVTKSPYINETNPMEYKRNYYAYISDYNGTKNRYVSRMDEEYDFTAIYIKYFDYTEKTTDTLLFTQKPAWSGKTFNYRGKTIVLDSTVEKIDTVIYNKDLIYTYPLTNYQRSVLAHDVSVQTKTTYDLMLHNNKFYIKMSPQERNIEESSQNIETYPNMFRLKSGVTNKPFTSGLRIFRSFAEEINNFDSTLTIADSNKENIETEIKIPQDTSIFYFISEFTPPEYKRPAYVIVPKTPANETIKKTLKVSTPQFYDVTFFADEVVTQLDNSIINSYYQPIGGAAAQMFNTGLNGMFKLGMIDLMEDYRFTGGVRVSFDASGFDYFASFETLKKRLDHKFVFYRQSRSGGVPENYNAVKSFSHELRYILKFPLSQTSSFKLNVFGRTDRDILRGSNNATLETPDRYTNWIGGKLEYVFDNTIPKGLNLWNGTRLKLFYERYANVDNWNIQLNAIGFDARHYEKVHRQIIWCTRLTANSSFGPAKVVYYLGGVENWITPRFNNETSTSSSENYVFQALAANLRGFEQNIRNGNSFVLLNTEFRIPIFQYAFNRPLRSEFLNNFQLVPFFDLGTAWIGPDPYGDENTFNQKVINKTPVLARVTNVRDPLVAGFGGGLRTKLLGYFIRFDTAWGIQDAEVANKPIYYFALGLDF